MAIIIFLNEPMGNGRQNRKERKKRVGFSIRSAKLKKQQKNFLPILAAGRLEFTDLSVR